MRIRCLCRCHDSHLAAARVLEARGEDPARVDAYRFLSRGFEGADVADPVAAAESCEACRKHHCAALRASHVWDEQPTPPPATGALSRALVPYGDALEPPRMMGDATGSAGDENDQDERGGYYDDGGGMG